MCEGHRAAGVESWRKGEVGENRLRVDPPSLAGLGNGGNLAGSVAMDRDGAVRVCGNRMSWVRPF